MKTKRDPVTIQNGKIVIHTAAGQPIALAPHLARILAHRLLNLADIAERQLQPPALNPPPVNFWQ